MLCRIIRKAFGVRLGYLDVSEGTLGSRGATPALSSSNQYRRAGVPSQVRVTPNR